jgi:hypothetical protein
MRATIVAICAMGVAVMGTGCEQPQEIEITSEPSKVAITVDNEYVGKTPYVYGIDDVNKFDKIRFKFERFGYESELMTLQKKPTTDMFPGKVHVILEPTLTPGEAKNAVGGQSQQMGGQQMQGPTIVIPGGSTIQPTPPGDTDANN